MRENVLSRLLFRLRDDFKNILRKRNNMTGVEEQLREIIASDMKMKEALRYIALVVLETRVEIKWIKRILLILLSVLLGLEGLNMVV